MIPGYIDNSEYAVVFRTGMHTEKAQHVMCWLRTVSELGIWQSNSFGIQDIKLKPPPIDLTNVRSLSLGVDDSFEICFYGKHLGNVTSDVSAYMKKLFARWCLDLLTEFTKRLPLTAQEDLSTLTMPVKNFLIDVVGFLKHDVYRAYALSEYDIIDVYDICSCDNTVTVKDLHDAVKILLGEAECPNELAGWPLNPIEVELANVMHNIFDRVRKDVIDEFLFTDTKYEDEFTQFIYKVRNITWQILNAWQEEFLPNELSKEILDHLSSSEIQLLNQWHEVMKSHNRPV